jgi:aryl-alcohol dehydrogenase-like predicted oxidoreductase
MQSLWAADKNGYPRYDSLQPHYNLVNRAEFERELAEVCQEYCLGVIPYSPLGGGFLTGKYRQDGPIPESERSNSTRKRYFNERGWSILEALETVAGANGKSLSQTALAWQLSDPTITSPIIGPRTLEQLEDNLGAVGYRLSDEQKKYLDKVSDWME